MKWILRIGRRQTRAHSLAVSAYERMQKMWYLYLNMVCRNELSYLGMVISAMWNSIWYMIGHNARRRARLHPAPSTRSIYALPMSGRMHQFANTKCSSKSKLNSTRMECAVRSFVRSACRSMQWIRGHTLVISDKYLILLFYMWIFNNIVNE